MVLGALPGHGRRIPAATPAGGGATGPTTGDLERLVELGALAASGELDQRGRARARPVACNRAQPAWRARRERAPLMAERRQRVNLERELADARPRPRDGYVVSAMGLFSAREPEEAGSPGASRAPDRRAGDHRCARTGPWAARRALTRTAHGVPCHLGVDGGRQTRLRRWRRRLVGLARSGIELRPYPRSIGHV